MAEEERDTLKIYSEENAEERGGRGSWVCFLLGQSLPQTAGPCREPQPLHQKVIAGPA